MDLELHLLVWKELSEHFTGSEIQDAADDFIRVLIEHGANAEEITEYALTDELKESLKDYIELDEEEFDDEEFDEEDIYA